MTPSTSIYSETLYEGYGQYFSIDRTLFEDQTEHQHLIIFENRLFGRVMALDGIIQTTERDEHVYHEMIVHLPILAHGQARRVLIVGGGDGASLREAVRHPGLEQATLVEIDPAVIEMSRRYLPNHSAGAFDHPKARIVIADGVKYVHETADRFDVIIVDSTDPVGPGEVLFSDHFYAGCKRCLNPGGILVTQNGVSFMQLDEVRDGAARLRQHFADVWFYGAAVPTYIGGIMAFGWATDNPALRQTPVATLRQRFAAAGLPTRYYTPEVHAGAFALPRYVVDVISSRGNGE
ncbi:MAG: polyamine aminopropyltransferase [Anaerolineales bacterium]|nr:polyamine aminopropyltransferase [Anaerolineales bacterium]